MPTSLIDIFAPKIENCNEYLNAGSINLVAPVPCGSVEPTVDTLTVDTALVGGEESIDLTSDNAAGTILREGSILHFASGELVTITATTTVTTGTTVPIEAAPVISAGDTGQTWALLRIKSPTNLPTNIEAQEVNRTDLTYGLQGGMVKSKIELNIQVTAIAVPGDKAVFDYILGASTSDADIYSLIVRSHGVTTAGRTKITGWTDDGNIEEISRPQWTYKYQPLFGIIKPPEYLTTNELAALNGVRKLSGLSVVTV